MATAHILVSYTGPTAVAASIYNECRCYHGSHYNSKKYLFFRVMNQKLENPPISMLKNKTLHPPNVEHLRHILKSS